MITTKGNGIIMAREIQVSSFVRLHLSITGVIELIQSTEEKIVIEADENLLDCFEIQNAGKTLYVSSEDRVRTPEFTACLVKVYLKQINVLDIRCDHGDIICKNVIALTTPLDIKIKNRGNCKLYFEAPLIRLKNQSVGNATLKGKCSVLEINNLSEGNLDVKEMIAGDLKIRNIATGDVEFYAETNISIFHSGEGNLFYYGNAILNEAKQNGKGIIQHM